jgi:hypothetical protein
MKMVKSLLLGTAAGIVGVAGASAADLPLKARPAEYVKVCSIYGAGFYYIPGTDTCIKIGGYMRAEWGFHANAGSNGQYINGANGRDNREVANTTTRSRGVLSFDTRTQTEYGTLRSYIRGGWELNSTDPNYRGTQYFDRGFIQFAGLTVGKTQSFFAFYANALNYSTEVGGGQFDVGINLAAYTMQFAGGFSATISLEEQSQVRPGLYNAANDIAIGTKPNDYGGVQYPDIVGNIRVDQPWGSAQIAGAVHDVYGLYQGALDTSGAAGDATGFAVAAGVKFNLPWSQGDTLWIQGTYAKGAANYLGLTPFVNFGGQFAMYNGSGAGRQVGLAWGMDGVYLGNSGIQLTEGWDINAAVEHYWTPSFRTSVFGHYTVLDFPGNAGPGYVNGGAIASGAKGAFCQGAGFTGSLAFMSSCDPGFSITQIGVRSIWSPVRNLDIGLEVLYTRLDQKMVGDWDTTKQGTRGAGLYEAADQDAWGGEIRFQRNFWP